MSVQGKQPDGLLEPERLSVQRESLKRRVLTRSLRLMWLALCLVLASRTAMAQGGPLYPPNSVMAYPTAVAGEIEVSWYDPNFGDPSAARYIVHYRGQDGSYATQTVAAPNTSTIVRDLKPEFRYYFSVQAEDSEGNRSAKSNEANAKPVGLPAPTLSGSAGDNSVILTWTEVTSPTYGLAGYNIYRYSDVPFYPYRRLNTAPITATTYTDNTVANGITFYYFTTGAS